MGLVRASLPVSLIVGLFKSAVSGNPQFIIFKIIYDFGVFTGIFEYLLTKKASK